MAGIDELDVGDYFTADQMANLFGLGYHPLAQESRARLDSPDGAEGADVSDADLRAAMRLGAPFRIYPGNATPFQVEVATRIAALGNGPHSARAGVTQVGNTTTG